MTAGEILPISDDEKRFFAEVARQANERLSLVSFVYFMSCSRENHKTALALAKEAGERFGITPILPHLKLDPETEDAYENLPRYVAEQSPGLLEALWDNLDIIAHLDQSDDVTAFLYEVAELTGNELGFGEWGERVLRPKGPKVTP